ncbi:hypothetical protein BN2127_JRS3_03780 [Bacillus safensis]|uniref:YfbU family protein n=1 Tax=Bacillus safensis TaxID=561879 RepID=UPI0006A8A291|nr:YfbU family protein [Bacillus safensis]CUB24276.1 hypothetical protein BN2127_JRS3_03780 [Bacillus safensis]
MSLRFTKEQRAILINQFEILKRLDNNNEKDYDHNIEVLFNGYSTFYKKIFGDIEDEFPEEITRKVYDVLDMFRVLYSSYEQLTSEEKKEIDEKDVLFKGFDGNEETNHFVFASFILRKTELYSDLQELIKQNKVEINSHRNIIYYYDELLANWSKIRKETKGRLSLEQIKYVLDK